MLKHHVVQDNFHRLGMVLHCTCTYNVHGFCFAKLFFFKFTYLKSRILIQNFV
jgi:hypothetical protein